MKRQSYRYSLKDIDFSLGWCLAVFSQTLTSISLQCLIFLSGVVDRKGRRKEMIDGWKVENEKTKRSWVKQWHWKALILVQPVSYHSFPTESQLQTCLQTRADLPDLRTVPGVLLPPPGVPGPPVPAFLVSRLLKKLASTPSLVWPAKHKR